MEQNNNYIAIMIDSLNKKVRILDEIISINEEQSNIITDIKKNMTEYDITLDKKAKLIDELNILDAGFQNIYDRIKDDIKNNSAMYADEIKQMQHLITQITDKSVQIQQSEERNRQVIETQFSKIKGEIKSFKENRQAATKYYKNMQNTQYVPSHFLDRKK